MRYWQTIQKDCPHCHGSGEVWCDEIRDGAYWTASVQCCCVEHHHDAEMKAFLRGVTAGLAACAQEGKSP